MTFEYMLVVGEASLEATLESVLVGHFLGVFEWIHFLCMTPSLPILVDSQVVAPPVFMAA